MLHIGVSEFRTNMNSVLQQVQSGEIVSLLLRGEEIAKIVPTDFAQTAAREELASLRELAVVGDVITPIDEEWNASGNDA